MRWPFEIPSYVGQTICYESEPSYYYDGSDSSSKGEAYYLLSFLVYWANLCFFKDHPIR